MVGFLLAIDEPGKRRAPEERAAKEDRSSRQAARHVRTEVVRAKRSQGGRRFVPPSQLEDLIQGIEHEHTSLLHLYAAWLEFVERIGPKTIGKRRARAL
jgi:hypothetical protein